MSEMTSCERVLTALSHKEPDRVPFDLGGAEVTGININALWKLRRHLGLEGEPELQDIVTQLAWTGADVAEKLGTDVVSVKPNPPANAGLARHVGIENGYDHLVDEFGLGWKMPVSGGHYYDLYKNPLADFETVKEVENYPLPDPLNSCDHR